MKNIGYFLLGFIAGLIAIHTYLSINYGRMVEHKTCDKKVELQHVKSVSYER